MIFEVFGLIGWFVLGLPVLMGALSWIVNSKLKDAAARKAAYYFHAIFCMTLLLQLVFTHWPPAVFCGFSSLIGLVVICFNTESWKARSWQEASWAIGALGIGAIGLQEFIWRFP